jgi:ATP-binding cassette subfamily C (CFTR/MRP) protein 1
MSASVGQTIGQRQKAWSQATQKRIAMTSSMLGSVKALKMMGLSDIIESNVRAQRVDEISVAADFRWMLVYFNVAANSVLILAPVGTFAAFTVIAWWRGETSLSTQQAFTSLALISMVSSPAQQLLVIFPSAASVGGCFSRIQKYLLDPSREDKRLGTVETRSASNGHRYTDEEIPNGNGNGNGTGNHIIDLPVSNLAIAVRNATIKPAATAEPALIDVSIHVDKSNICIVAGPVGCGKSTLARAILGELPTETGEIETSSRRIGYCSQTAWLSNGSIKENIVGPIDESEIDQTWYESVLSACALERDLSLLSDGDESLIGSRGLVLSGGQKQRVALARAVYARTEFILLDDVLSALDAKTERVVVEKLLGPKGLFRKLNTTVILITHSTQLFHLADHIVIIGTDKKIAEQGTFQELRAQEGYISKLLVKEDHDDKHNEEEESKMTNNKDKRVPAVDAAADLTRKTGDTAIYGTFQIETFRIQAVLTSPQDIGSNP